MKYFLKIESYRIPLKPVSFWARGSFSVNTRNEFEYVNNKFNMFIKENNINYRYIARSVEHEKQSNIKYNNHNKEDLNVFFTTSGHPEGEVPEDIKNLFILMEQKNICAPISGDDNRIISI